jgi:hypothetical protein
MKRIRKVRPGKANNKPKGSFPSIHDDIVLAPSSSSSGNSKMPRKRSVANTVLGKVMNFSVRMATSKVAKKLGKHHHISFDQSLSRDSTIREEEIFLMDYVDGTFEV